MPEKATKERAQRAKRAGKSASTQAGEFVREEMHHIREGKHGAKSAKQAVAIGLNKARRSGVKLKGKAGSSSSRPGKSGGTRKSSASRSTSKSGGRKASASKSSTSRKSSGSRSSPSKRSTAKRASPKRTSARRSAAIGAKR